jgi:ABC-type transport system involved in cytochrome c biogenesis permease subunit
MIEEVPFLGIACACFLIAAFIYAIHLAKRGWEFGYAGTWTSLLGAAILAGGLLVRAVRVGHWLPFGVCELSLTLALAIVSLYILLEHLVRIKEAGAFVMPLVLLVHTYALLVFCLSSGGSEASAVASALRSPWFGLYTLGVLLAYGFFAVACGASLLYLCAHVALARGVRISPSLEVIDGLNYRAVAYGFPWLTLGLAAGSWWAWRTWGSYWHWSSAEIGILVPWLIYAASLHLRRWDRWAARYSALFSTLGFVVVLLTLLGGYVLTGELDVIGSLTVY